MGGRDVSPISPGDSEGDFGSLWLSPLSTGDSLEAEGCLLVSVIVLELFVNRIISQPPQGVNSVVSGEVHDSLAPFP